MAAVQRIAPHIRDIHVPAALRDLRYWLVWRYETRPLDKKPRKVPYYPGGERRYGQQGTPSDLARLTTFSAAREAAVRRGMDGVGFAHTHAGGIVTLDFDKCVTDGKVDPRVLDLVQGTYAEYSPSGTGIHAIFEAPSGILGNGKSYATDDLFGTEAFSSVGFTTFSGWMLEYVDLVGLQDTVAPLPGRVIEYCRERFGRGSGAAPVDPDDFTIGHEPKVNNLPEEDIGDLLAKLDPDMGRDEWIRVGMALHHQTDGSEDGFWLWNDWSEQGGKYSSEESLRQQWESFDRPMAGRRRVTMATVLGMVRDLERGTVSAGELIVRAEALVADLPPAQGVQTPAEYTGRFPISTALSATQRKPVDWLIKSVMPAADLILIYGASGSGKSFVALDMAMSIATGTPWMGQKTRRGKVVIVAAEGAGGYGSRIQAMCQHRGVDPATLEIGLITVPPNLLNKEDVVEIVAALKTVPGISLIIVDTLAQTTPGANENAGEDMGLALANTRAIGDTTEATVALVHHSGKDAARGARGWSGMRAAVDAEIEVSRDPETDLRQILVTKQKDGRDGLKWNFRLEGVVLSMDEDGDEISSCVVIEAEASSAKVEERKGVKRRGRVEAHIIEIMSTFASRDAVEMEQIVRAAVDAMPPPPTGERDTRRQNVVRALQKLSREVDGPLKVMGNTVIFYE